jgi:hypothetical protein
MALFKKKNENFESQFKFNCLPSAILLQVLLVADNYGRGRGVIPSLAGPGEQS